MNTLTDFFNWILQIHTDSRIKFVVKNQDHCPIVDFVLTKPVLWQHFLQKMCWSRGSSVLLLCSDIHIWRRDVHHRWLLLHHMAKLSFNHYIHWAMHPATPQKTAQEQQDLSCDKEVNRTSKFPTFQFDPTCQSKSNTWRPLLEGYVPVFW